MHNFKEVTSLVLTLSLLMLMCQSVGYTAQISKSVNYRAEINPFGKIDKEISFPPDHDPFYLHVSFLLSPGTVTADFTGEIIFDQDDGTITLRGSGGHFSTDGGVNFTGSIEMDFVMPVNFYTLLFALPAIGVAFGVVDLIFDLPEIEVPVDGTVTIFDLGPHWRESKSVDSFLLNGESVTVTAGIRDILSKKLSAVDLAGIIVTATTGIPPFAVDVAEDVIKIGLGDSRISLNAGLTSNLTLSGEAIIVNGQRVVKEGQSIPAPGLDPSQNSYEVNTTYVEDFTSTLDLVFSADVELSFNPLGIQMWAYDEPIAKRSINIVPERERSLNFRTTPNPIVLPIEETAANQAPQTVGSIDALSLTAGGSAATVDVSPYFSDPGDTLTYFALSNNGGVATVETVGSQLTITPRARGSAGITVSATDSGDLTATQRFTVTVEARHSCTYALSQGSKNVPASGESISVDVATAAGCHWTASSNNSFLSVSPSSGTGRATVTVTVDKNVGASNRSGSLTIADNTFTVNQAARSMPTGQFDLAIQSLTVSKDTVTPGESFTLSVTVNNTGPGSSEKIGISYYHSFILGLSQEDRVQWQGTVWADPLASGESITKQIGIEAPSTPDTYYYGAWLAAVSGDTNIRNDVASEVGVTVSTLNAVGANEINIPDPNLRAKIERALNKQAGDPITAAEMATLTSLNARDSNIRDLTGLKFATNLTLLNLYDNKISTLPAGVFEGLNKVTILHLKRNPLKTIKTGAFNGLSSLTKLDLSSVYTNRRSHLTTIESGAFDGLSSLKELNLYYNSLTTLPTGAFQGLSKVTSLNLRKNLLKTIEESAFNGLSSLTKLDLSSVYTNRRSHLTTIESGAFDGLSSLKELNLYYNSLTTLPTGAFQGLSKVTSLNLRKNLLKTIEESAFNGLSSLTKLDLSSVYTNRRSHLTTIESGAFDGLSSLKELNLYYNSLTTLPTGAFQGLSKVTSLNLKRNLLKTIKTGAFNGLSSLTKLDLSSAYTNSRGHLTVIESGTFKGLSSLKELNLYYNSLTTLPTGAFQGLSKVTSLNLRKNLLRTIKTGAFNGLSSLTKLDLSSVYTNRRSHLTVIESGTFDGLSSLKELNLYYNNLKTLPTGVFKGLSSLTTLNLHRNPGTPFTLRLELARTDTADLEAPGPATVVVKLAQGAPFEATVNLSVEGGTLSATTAAITRGNIQSDPITVQRSGKSPATVSLGTPPVIPSGYFGIKMAVGDSLVRFSPIANQAPLAVDSIPAQNLDANGVAVTVDVTPYFSDPDDEDTLTYSATSDNLGAASVIISGAIVTITPKSPGDATVTVTASDGRLTATQRIAVTVEAAPRVRGDVSGDGVVNIQDLVLVAGRFGQAGDNGADVNGDGVVNILDLVLVAGALGNVAAAPTAWNRDLEIAPTESDVRQWLAQTRLLELTDPEYHQGIAVLQHLLVALTPKETALLPNYPNPFNPETWMPYRLAGGADVQISIYDAKGMLIRRLDVGHQSAGFYTDRTKAAYWDGRNASGEAAASGIYHYQFRAGDYSQVCRMVIIK